MGKCRYQRAHRPAVNFHLEKLDSRLLYSADAALLVADTGQHEAANVAVITGDVGISSDVTAEGADSDTKVLSTEANELVVIDAAAPDLDALLADFSARHDKPRVVLLEAGGDVLQQLGALLGESKDLSAVHLFSHGADGELELGGQRITTVDLLARANEISGWRGAFADGADFLIYGCDVASSADGRVFVDTLARLTQTDVAASTNLTGSSERGGDWRLEYARGEINTDVAASDGLQMSYDGTLATYVVTDYGDSGTNTLRWAIEQVNAGSGSDGIAFSGAGGTISLASELPAIVRSVEIDATVGNDYINQPIVTIDGSSGLGTGLRFETGSDNSTVRGLAIINMPNYGISLDGVTGVTIELNYIGTDGTTDQGNGSDGIHVSGSAQSNNIGGANTGNVISGNGQSGVHVTGTGTDGNSILGNTIGLNATGTAAIQNDGSGILVDSDAKDTIVGSSLAGAGNVVSGNADDGIDLSGSGVTGTVVQGNIVGLYADGLTRFANSNDEGVQIADGANNNLIGGDAAAGEGNVISGNDDVGLAILFGSDQNRVMGNIIGLDKDGVNDLGNDNDGIRIANSSDENIIGGSIEGDGNIVSGNGGYGITIDGVADTQVLGNFIGTTSDGISARANDAGGLVVRDGAERTLIGGSGNHDMNLISGNSNHGIDVDGSGVLDTVIQGNRLGTDLIGSSAIANSATGILVRNGAVGTIIGGDSDLGEGNQISGNNSHGVHTSAVGSGTVIQGNVIGLGSDGFTALGNTGSGVYSENSDITIGGISNGAGNVISSNGNPFSPSTGAGVWLFQSNGSDVIGNIIGLDVDGRVGLGNEGYGVSIIDTDNSVVGAIGFGNTVSANESGGISVSNSDGTIIVANRIGTGLNINNAIGNNGTGVVFSGNSSSNTVGGTSTNQGNIIRANSAAGIAVTGSTSTGNAFLLNSIAANGGLGIDLDTTGVLSNDSNDADAGANNLQNYPVLTSVLSDHTGAVQIQGSIASEASLDYRVDYYASVTEDPLMQGEAERYLGTSFHTTDGSGLATINESLSSVTLSDGEFVSSTMTSLDGGGVPGSTSEFSMNVSADAQLNLSITNPVTVQGTQNTVLVFDGSNVVQVSDGLAADTPLLVALSVASGTLTLNTANGIVFVAGSDNSASMVIEGTESAINTVLNKLEFTPALNYSGPETLTVSVVLDNELQGYYTFENDSLDQSAGTPYDGTLQNGAVIVNDTQRGNVLSLDGVDDYVTIPGYFGNPADVSLAAWVNLTAADSGGSELLTLGNNVILRLDDPSGGVTAAFYDGSAYQYINNNTFIAGTGWRHVAFTFDDTSKTGRLFFDGAQVASTTTTGSISYAFGTETRIGRHGTGETNRDFNGLIDDARVYARALSDAEIKALSADEYVATAAVSMTVAPSNNRSPVFHGPGGPAFTPFDVSTAIGSGRAVATADIDGDGDLDVLSASYDDDRIAWHENDGSGIFTLHTITTGADGARDVSSADIDGDGDLDVISASWGDDSIIWYENDGNGNFISHTIATNADWAISVTAADIDGDGHMDVLSASQNDDRVVWYRNDGNEVFSANVVATSADGPTSVTTADVDGDGDIDILSSSTYDDKIAWYENQGTTVFPERIIATDADGARQVATADVDGDGDLDVLSASFTDNEITWYENNGSQVFTPFTIATGFTGAWSVKAVDLDSDGDVDVVGTALNGYKVTWFENNGSESFTTHDIATDIYFPYSVASGDLDGDGNIDVLTALSSETRVAWYKNTPVTLDGNPTYVEGGAPVVLDADVTVTDFELDALNGGSGDYTGATLTIVRNGAANSDDVLGFNDGNGLSLLSGDLIKNGLSIASFDTSSVAGELTVTFVDNGETPTTSDVSSVLQQITLENSNDTPPASVQIDWTFDDGNSGSQGTGGALQATGSTTVSITATNDAPVVTADTGALAYTENAGAVAVSSGLTVSDVDSTNLTDAEVQITGNYVDGEDELAFATLGGISGSFASGTGILTLIGTATVAQYETALRTITFENTSDSPTVGTRTVSVTVNDGAGANNFSNTATRDIAVSAVNDAPTATNLNVAESYTEDTPLDLTDIVVSDVDSATVTVTLTLSDTAAGTLSTATSNAVTSTFASGVWSANGAITDVNALLAGVTFTPAADYNNDINIATSVDDGVAAAVTGSKTLTGTALNDAPTATNLNAAESYTEDTPLDLTDIVVSDVDSATVTVTLTLSDTAAGTLSTATSNAVTSTFASGVWSANGAITDVNALLAGVTFTPAADYNSDFVIGTRVEDDSAAVLTSSKSVSGTAVNDGPTLSTNTLTISEGATVVLSATEVSATDIDNTDSLLTFTASGISGGQFEINTNAGVAITSFNQQQVTDGEVQFVHDGGEVAPAYSISVSDGSLSTTAAAATITFTNVNDGPTLSTNTLTISEGATVVLSATEVSATDVDTDDATLVFTTSGISGGQFENNTNVGVSITSFTQQQVTDGEVQFVHDGGEGTPAYSISISDGSLSTTAAAATITFTNVNDGPTLSTNTLTISEGATVVLSATEVSATDVDTDEATLVFTASGISGGQFEINTNAGVAITSFTQQQVTDGEVQFVHDGGEVAPAYSISVSDGSLSTTAAAATIAFTNVNDGPMLSTNTLTITEGATVVLSATEVSATDIDTDDATLVFTTSGISGGQFEVNTNAGVAITSFTQQQITDGEVQFVHDGGEAAPAYSISVSDGSLSTTAAAATITFTNVNDGPTLSTNTLTISEGATVVLSATEVSATDIDNTDSLLTFTALGISGGQFEINTNAGVAITSFNQQQVTDGEVQFVHDGGEVAPAYSISVSDGSLSTTAATATITFTNVNDGPTLSTNTLTISEGATVVLSATELSATDIDNTDSLLTFTASGISGGQFEDNTNVGVAIISFTQQQVTDGEVQFVHDGGEVAPAYSISVSDGSLSTTAATATITFTNVNDGPTLSTNTLTISEGATVVLSATEVSATDIDTDDTTLVFTASGISGGQFEINTNAGVAITSFTQQQVTDGEVQFVHDGGEVAPAYSISVSDGSLSTTAAAATITFTNVNDGPTLSTNTLTISEGATVVLSATEVSATDIDNTDSLLTFTASGISGGQFEVNANAGVAITSFTQQQITDGEVQFVHDGGEAAPAYSISVSDGSLSTTAAAATITFTNVNDGPTLSTNTLTISEGATVLLSATELSATDIDNTDSLLTFTASGISGGQFEVNTNAGVAITSFTQQQITDGEVQFVHDGGEAAPAYSISVSDGSLSTTAAAATITFTNVNDGPTLSTNTLTISEGATVVLSATEVSATDIDNTDSLLTFTALGISGGQFEDNTNAGVAITSFTQQQVADGEVQFVHDGGEVAPAYSISISDGSLSTTAAAATITFTNVNDGPTLSTNTLTISEGATVVLSATEVSATDIDNTDSLLTFTALGISGGQFENNNNVGVSITSFTQQQVTDGEVQFVHDGGEAAPAYSISVSDGSLSTTAAAATITFTNVNDGPTLSTNTLTISEGATVVLSATEVSATDVDTDDATLVFTTSGISGGQFENNTNVGVSITSFTQQQVTDGEVQFVHDGGEGTPAYSISVSDGSLSTTAAAATITFTNVNDGPTLSTNTLTISEGATVVLSATEVSATDIDTDDATLVFTASGISGGQFEVNTNAGVAITSFTQQEVTDGEVQFVHDGGEVAPSYSISVSDGSLSTTAAAATITFTNVNDGPTLSTNTLTISEGATVVLSATEVSATDIDNTDSLLTFTASGISGGQFENNNNAGVAITSFTQQQVTDGEVQFVHDGGEAAPSYSISVSDGSLSTTAAAATIAFTNVNDGPMLSTNTLTITEGATVVLSATEVSATDVDTDEATLVFTASGISGGQFEDNTNAGVAITSFTQQQVTDGEVQFVHDGGEVAPSYSISVSDGSLSTTAATATIAFTNVNDGPTLSTNTLTISEGATVLLSATELSATDIDNTDSLLTFTASGISGGQFEINTNAGVAITSFTQQQITDDEVQFVHDGGEVAPAYSISVSDGSLSTTAAAATITFTNVNDAPTLTTNTLTISEGATVLLSATELSATDIDNTDSLLTFTASSISGGQFEINTNAGVAITSFTQQQITDDEVQFVHDGGEVAPAYSISVSDGSLSTTAAAATITFTNVNDAPTLTTNTLTISEGATVLLSATELSATDIDNTDSLLTFTASGISGGQFEVNTNAGVAITSFTQQQITDGEVQFVHDGGEAAPAYSISVSDGSLSTTAAAATITFTNVNDGPTLSTNTLTISEGATVVLSATEVSATDVDTDDATLVFTTSGISGGQFENNTNVGVSITSFTQQQVTDGEVQFVHDGGEGTPAYSISISDGSLSTTAAAATITFTNVNDGPTLSTNTLTISEGATVVLSATEVSATDVDTDEATLVFTASGISGGQFEINTNAGVAITSFTQQQVTDGEVQFVHDSGEVAPSYSISVSDGSLSTTAAAATITFTNVNDGPTLSTNTLTISEGATVVLSATEVSATDIDNTDSLLTFTASGISGGQFENNNNAGVAITSFTQQQVTDGEVQFVHDGGEAAPAYSISVSDGSLSTTAAAATITFTNVNDAPVVTTDTGALAYTENAGAVAVSSGLTVSDADSTNLNGAVVQITGDYVNGEDQLAFATLGEISGSFVPGTGTLTLTGTATVVQYEAALRTIIYENTSENPTVGTRAVSVTVNDGAGANNLSNSATRDITVSAVNDAPTATNLNAAESYTEDTVLDLIDIVVNDVDSASVIVALTLSDTSAGILSTATSNAVTSTFAGGVWSASGVLADVNTLLAGVTFTPTNNYNSNFSIATSVGDGVAPAMTGSKAFTGTAVNDAPIIVGNGGSDRASLAVNENQTAVTTVVAIDLDAGNMLTYSLAGTDAIAFNIDQSNGILTFALAPDYETKNTYIVDVIATDDGSVPLTDTQRVNITVIDINEAPEITSNGGANTVTIPVDENQTAVTTVQAIDQDADTTLAYSLTGIDATAFSIDNNNGLLTFNSAPDYETKNTYHLEIVVSDNGINPLTDRQNLTVTVVDADDDLRVAEDILTTREDTLLLFDPAAKLLANDFDPKGGELGFHSFEQPEHGMLIQNSDGLLEYTPNANFNGLDQFTYTVVDEVGNTASARVSIDVEPVNDLPMLVPGPANGPDVAPTPGVIDANAVSDGEIEVFENTISIGQVTASDVDGDEVSFTLAGPDAGLFEIDVSTGELRPSEPLDFEAPRDVDGDNRYDLEILVTDGSGALIQIPLSVTAVNTNEPPQLIDASFTTEEGFSGELGSLTAIDLDAGDELLFALGATPVQGVSLLPDGRLIADGLEPGTYEIEVLITDSGNLVSVGFIVVNVTALSDTLPSLGAANIVEAETNTPSSPVNVIQGSISYSVTETSNLSEERAPVAVTFLASPHVVDFQLAEPVFSTSFLLSSVNGVDAAQMSLKFLDSLKLSDNVQQDMLWTEEMRTGLPLPPQTLLDLIDQIRASFDKINEDTEASEKRMAFVVAFGGITLSIGVAGWVLASRVLLAAAFSTAPLWRSIDPIPVLLGGDRDEEDEVVSEENGEENSASDKKATNG